MPETVCPMHKSTLRQLSSPLQTKEGSLLTGEFVVMECEAPSCPVKYSMRVAPDWNGFFMLDENGRAVPLPSLTSSNADLMGSKIS